MNKQLLELIQTVAGAMAANPALKQQQIELVRQHVPGADPAVLEKLVELCARPGGTAQSLAAGAAPLMKQLLAESPSASSQNP